MDAVPRISRAQSLDVLSSMANIAGYRAVIEAAHTFGRFFTGQVTAAGKVPPAKVLVAGAGVAGLAAIGAASSLGAIVRATDVRPEVAEQVRSLGGEYVAVPAGEAEVSADGYAREMGEDFNRRAAADVRRAGARRRHHHHHRPHPRPARAAADHRGDGRLDEVGQRDRRHGRRAGRQRGRLGAPTSSSSPPTASRSSATPTSPAGCPAQASQLYGQNLVSLLTLLTPGKDGQLVLDFDDVVQRAMTVVRDGEKTWPPPPVQVSAAPAPVAAAAGRTSRAPRRHHRRRGGSRSWASRAALLFLVTAFSPNELIGHFTVFALAVVVGFYVIGHVHHALHTPLMSVTNAISGIIVVGALLQIGHDEPVVTVLATVAILLASINVFGGFAVTRRMLGMFTR